MKDPERAKAKRVTEAMLKMVKLDIAELEAAARG
jgi:predicted 3-demethylubiquinone-9 3-methyltransferase (glyoxalase superfamily)